MKREALTLSYKCDLLLDSGAFSAWNQGKTIKVKDYIRFVKDYRQYLWQYVCLDHIPGEPFKERSPKDTAYAVAKSYENQQEMKAAGLSPIPVFHQGEDPKWLERYMEDHEPYIGVSPLDDTPRDSQEKFLDVCYNIICDSKGRPLAKTHGFGTTSFNFLHRFPLTTADSTTWSYGIAYGRLYLPQLEEDGTPRYDTEPAAAFVTGAGYSNNMGGQPKLDEMPETKFNAVKAYLAKYVGCTPELARYSTYWRRRVAITYLEGLAKATSGKPFKRQPISLIDDPPKLFTGEPLKASRSVVYATAISRDRSRVLNDMDIRRRLLSYWLMRDTPDDLPKYVIKGTTWDGEGDDEREPVPITYEPRAENTKPKPIWGMTYSNYRALKLLDRIAELKGRPDEEEYTG